MVVFIGELKNIVEEIKKHCKMDLPTCFNFQDMQIILSLIELRDELRNTIHTQKMLTQQE